MVAELSLKFDKHGERIFSTFETEVFVPLLPSVNKQATPKKIS